MSPSRFHDCGFLTRVCPYSRGSGSDEAGHAIGDGSNSSQPLNGKRRRFVYDINHPPIGWLIVPTSDPRNVGILTILTTSRMEHRCTVSNLIGGVVFG